MIYLDDILLKIFRKIQYIVGVDKYFLEFIIIFIDFEHFIMIYFHYKKFINMIYYIINKKLFYI